MPRVGSLGAASLLLLGLVLNVSAAALSSEQPEQPPAPARPQVADAKEFQRRIDELNDDRFEVRQRAYSALLELGEGAVPHLLAASQDGPREQVTRIRQLIETIRQRTTFVAFQRLAASEDDEIDVEEGMWLISRLLNPDVQLDDLKRQLDELAGKVRERLGPEFSARTTDPRLAVDTLLAVLFVELGFAGNVTNYNSPDNSSLEKVLSSRRGLPILLSHVVVSVAARLELPIVGVAVPGRYMAKYDGTRAPAGYPQTDIIIDAFAGQVITAAELQRVGFDSDEDLEPANHRALLTRMLTNLVAALTRAGDTARAHRTARCRHILNDHRPRGRGM